MPWTSYILWYTMQAPGLYSENIHINWVTQIGNSTIEDMTIEEMKIR